MALADPGVAHQILWLRLVRPLIVLFKLDPRFTVMFSDLTGSCRQCCCTPCPAVPREGTLLPPGFLSTSNPTFAKWSLFGCPFPSTAWVFFHQSASSACSHAQELPQGCGTPRAVPPPCPCSVPDTLQKSDMEGGSGMLCSQGLGQAHGQDSPSSGNQSGPGTALPSP